MKRKLFSNHHTVAARLLDECRNNVSTALIALDNQGFADEFKRETKHAIHAINKQRKQRRKEQQHAAS